MVEARPIGLFWLPIVLLLLYLLYMWGREADYNTRPKCVRTYASVK